MSYEFKTYDDPDDGGAPCVVLVVRGVHDVSRIVSTLERGLCEQYSVAQRITASVRRHYGGRAALRLLKAHGGLDLTVPEPEVRGYVVLIPNRSEAFEVGATGTVFPDERPARVEAAWAEREFGLTGAHVGVVTALP